MKNTIEAAQVFLDKLIAKIGKPMNAATRLFWEETLVEYGKEVEQSEWIKVSDRKPEPDKEVWVANGNSVYCLTHHISSMGNWYAYGESRANTFITHWKPMCPPPIN